MSLFKNMKNGTKKHQSVRTQHLVTEGVSFNVSEAFRNLKASLSVSIPKKINGEGVVIMLTSAYPSDGKTTVAVNLALTYAEAGSKVVIVDADVRKGRVARFFKAKSVPGLTDGLSGQAALKDVVRKTNVNENLSYISCGTHSPRPYELLESEEMKNLLENLKKEYDYVIIDTPPVLMLSDALALVPQVDGTVLVCRHETSYVSDIAKTLNTLSFAKANVLGVVVNGYNERSISGKSGYGKYEKYEYYYSSVDESPTAGDAPSEQ